MSLERLYTVKEAAERAGVSVQSIYTYTTRYHAYFSSHATPGKGQPRLFSAGDVRLLAYIRYKTTTGKLSHKRLVAALAADSTEFEAFCADTVAVAEAPSTLLVDLQALQAFQLLLQDTRQREQQAAGKVEDLQQENAQLRQQLGVMQGKVAVFESVLEKVLRLIKFLVWKYLLGRA